MRTSPNQQAAPGDRLFVYGTLQRDGQYHALLHRAEFIGPAQTRLPYPLILDRYPCLLDRPGEGHRVHGELYKVLDATTWKEVDHLEDHPREYRRRPETVLLASRQPLTAWIYFYNNPDLPGTPVPRFQP